MLASLSTPSRPTENPTSKIPGPFVARCARSSPFVGALKTRRGVWARDVPDGTSNIQAYSDPVVFERGGPPTTDVSCAETLASDSGSANRRTYATPSTPEG